MTHPHGPLDRQGIKLTKDNLDALDKLRLQERVVTMMLEGHSRKEIGEELDLAPSQLKRIIESPEFKQALDEAAIDATKDPRRAIVQHHLADMLPLATEKLLNLLNDPHTKDTVRLNAIRMVFELNGIRPSQIGAESDAEEFREFLKRLNVRVDGDLNITQVNQIPLPAHYQEAVALVEPEVIDLERS